MGPNRFTHNLQELAFFSWFYGAIDRSEWLSSDNNSFTTDAGPVPVTLLNIAQDDGLKTITLIEAIL